MKLSEFKEKAKRVKNMYKSPMDNPSYREYQHFKWNILPGIMKNLKS